MWFYSGLDFSRDRWGELSSHYRDFNIIIRKINYSWYQALIYFEHELIESFSYVGCESDREVRCAHEELSRWAQEYINEFYW